MSIFRRQAKYDPLKSMWIFNIEKSEAIPCATNENSSMLLVLNGTNLALPNDAEIVKKIVGSAYNLLSYEEICALYDPCYDNSADHIAEFKEESIKNGGYYNGDPDSTFMPRYTYIYPTTLKGMQKISNYLMNNKLYLESVYGYEYFTSEFKDNKGQDKKYNLCSTLWVCDSEKDLIIPAISNVSKTQLLLADGKNTILPFKAENFTKTFGENAKLLTYDEICKAYDKTYKNHEQSQSALKFGYQVNTYPDGVQLKSEKYKYYGPKSLSQMQEVKDYLLAGKKEIDANGSMPQR